jgi:hypothetical protein
MTPSFRCRFPCGRRPTRGDGAGLRDPAWGAFIRARHGVETSRRDTTGTDEPSPVERYFIRTVEPCLSKSAHLSSLRPRTSPGRIWVFYRRLIELWKEIRQYCHRQQATYSHQACPTESVSIILRTARRVCAQRLVFLPLLTGPALFHAARVFAENVARVTDTVVPCGPASVSSWAPS